MKKLWIFSFLFAAMIGSTALAQAHGVPTVSRGMLFLCCMLVGLGLFTHLVSKLAELEMQGKMVTPWKYVTEHPYTSMSVVLSSYGLLLLAYYTGEAGPVGSFCMGVAAQSAGDKLRARAEARISRIDGTENGVGK